MKDLKEGLYEIKWDIVDGARTPVNLAHGQATALQAALILADEPYRTIRTKLQYRIQEIEFPGKENWSSETEREEKGLIKMAFQNSYLEKWNSAKLSSGFNRSRKEAAGCSSYSHIWLKKPGLSRRDVKKVLLLQDGIGSHKSWLKTTNRETDDRCRRCGGAPGTVGHILGGCNSIPFALLKERHDGVVLQIANEIITQKGLGSKIMLADAGKRTAHEDNGFKIVLDQRVTMIRDKERTSQLPDIICIDDKKKRVTVLEIGVSAEDLIACKELEKEEKYKELGKKLGRQYQGYNVKTMGFVIRQLGVISKESILKLHKFRRRIMGKKDMHTSYRRGLLVSKMLNVTLKGSLNIYRWFVSRSPTPPWEKRDPLP